MLLLNTIKWAYRRTQLREYDLTVTKNKMEDASKRILPLHATNGGTTNDGQVIKKRKTVKKECNVAENKTENMVNGGWPENMATISDERQARMQMRTVKLEVLDDNIENEMDNRTSGMLTGDVANGNLRDEEQVAHLIVVNEDVEECINFGQVNAITSDAQEQIMEAANDWKESQRDSNEVKELREQIRLLEYKNSQLTDKVTRQQSALEKQSTDIMCLHQRLTMLEQRPFTTLTIHQPMLNVTPDTTQSASLPHLSLPMSQLNTLQQIVLHEPATTPLAQPQDEELPEELKMKLLLEKEDTKLVSKLLLAYYFTEEERLTSNISGTRNAKKLDPNRMEKVKKLTFQYSPVPSDQRDKVWRSCEIAIDNARRNKKREMRIKAAIEYNKQAHEH